MTAGRRRRPAPARALVIGAAAAGAGVLLSACAAGGGEADGRPDVLASIYPLQYVAERIGADRVDVASLVPPGGSSHGLELSAAQVGAVGEADLLVHQSHLQPAADEAIEQQASGVVVDAARTAEDAGVGDAADPHVWLDPVVMTAVAEQVGAAMAEVDPDGAAAYEQATDALVADLAGLDADYSAGLAGCQGATVVTSHEAFGHLAARYGLEQTGITGVDPEVEPSPARLRDVAEVVQAEGVRTVFFESSSSPEVAATMAEDLGVTMAVLDPLERHVDGAPDYLATMRANLVALQDGLVCAG